MEYECYVDEEEELEYVFYEDEELEYVFYEDDVDLCCYCYGVDDDELTED